VNRVLQILLAEDNRADVLLVREALNFHHLGYELHVASDGLEAARYIQRIDPEHGVPCPDLLLLDLNLPKKDGFEVLTVFRAHPMCASHPVIVISSSGAPRDRERVAELSARFFRKPTDLDDFMTLGALVRETMRGGAKAAATV
jgi:CheY-like chemotaxis protein